MRAETRAPAKLATVLYCTGCTGRGVILPEHPSRPARLCADCDGQGFAFVARAPEDTRDG